MMRRERKCRERRESACRALAGGGARGARNITYESDASVEATPSRKKQRDLLCSAWAS